MYLETVKNLMMECASCGLCRANCPIFKESKLESTTARGKIIICYNLLIGNLHPSMHVAERLYQCTTCKACTTTCLSMIDIPKIVEAARSDLIEEGLVPRTIRDMLVATQKYFNPWGQPMERRINWLGDLSVKILPEKENVQVLYFVGCTPAYDPRCQEIARSVVKIFNKANVDFGILANNEVCCGEPALRAGERGLFEILAETNIDNFRKCGVNKIVTTSPHCYSIFKNEYPLNAAGIEVQHYTQFLANLIDQGKLKFSKTINKLVTYHDPCFLGRHNGIYDDPRKILESIPGLTFVEMDRIKENSFCCGGGGAMMWMETKTSDERASVDRVREAISLNPDIIVTACPWCVLNLEDALKVIGREDIRVLDVAELVKEAL